MQKIKLGSKELRKTPPTPEELASFKRNPIYLVLDNVLDTYNIGSLFRLADAIAAKKVYLCGNMEYPPSSRIHKAAVGTEEWVPWEKADNCLDVIKKLKQEGVHVVAVEQSPRAISYKHFKPQFPLALIVGHETEGINSKVLEQADEIVELPMFGVNKSFNVWGSAAVLSYLSVMKLL